MYKIALTLAVTFIMLLIGAGCRTQMQNPGDTIIPPTVGNFSGEGPKSSDSLNNMLNISPFAQPSTDMVYTLLDKTSSPLSISADNKYLYLLLGGESTVNGEDMENNVMDRYGSVIEIRNVENGSLVKTINNKNMGMCSAFTVKESNLYTFDMKTGRVSLFSSGGSFLTSYDTGLTGVYADKIAIADNRFILLKIRENAGDSRKIAVFNPDTGEVSKYKAYRLYNSPAAGAFDIIDFSLFDKESVLVGLSCGRLILFNIEKAVTEKSCVFPMTAGFMEYKGNVLYYTADAPVYLNPGNTANFSNISMPRQAGRLLINSEFSWPQSEEELGKWFLNSLNLPAADKNGRHYDMSSNTKYLFFLDFIPAEQTEDKYSKPGFSLYRITK